LDFKGKAVSPMWCWYPESRCSIFLIDTVVKIVPKNSFSSISTGNILPTIFFCLIFGIGVAFLRESEEERVRDTTNTVFKFFEGGAEVMYKVVNWILQYAPIGVFALIAVVFGKQGAEAFGPLGIVTFSVYLALIVHMVLVYGGCYPFIESIRCSFYPGQGSHHHCFCHAQQWRYPAGNPGRGAR
jgi:Na+/H+-dicarboxylate symporter